MACEWVKRGYKVTVLTGIPNYPMGKFFDGYDYKHRRRELWNGVEIIRIPLIPRGNNSNKLLNAMGMIANYLSFVISGKLWVTHNNIDADLVFTVEVSPMTQALIGCWYSKRYRVPAYLYVQDLWPENVEIVTGIHSRVIIKPIEEMVKWIYKNTDHIFTTSPSFVKEIEKRGANREKVHYWPQYAEEFYQPLNREDIRARADASSLIHLIPNDGFNIAFTGNIGMAQGLDILPKVAEKLKKNINANGRNIHFIIIGDGRYQGQFIQEIKKHDVGNMFILIPRQPAKVIPSLLSCCDTAFLSFSPSKLWEMTIPAKLQSYMACGLPVIAVAKGETERVVSDAKCGVCSEIGNDDDLMKCILEIQSSDYKTLGENSRLYAQKYFNKEKLMNEMDMYFGGQ